MDTNDIAYASAAELIFTHHDSVGGELGRVVCFTGVGLYIIQHNLDVQIKHPCVRGLVVLANRKGVCVKRTIHICHTICELTKAVVT